MNIAGVHDMFVHILEVFLPFVRSFGIVYLAVILFRRIVHI
jgi:hypothetical protein